MLMRFNVKNFLSFGERENAQSEEFSLFAGKVRNKYDHVYNDGKVKLLKFSAIYGANASGKSNFVKSLDFMRKFVLNQSITGYMNSYCKVNEENKNKNSYFEVEIMINNKYYSYGFEILLNQGKVVSEWLIELIGDGRERNIFTRDVENGNYEFGDILNNKTLMQKLVLYASDVQDDGSILYLSLMNKNKKTLYEEYEEARVLKYVYQWFEDELAVHYPNRPISDYSYMLNSEAVDDVCKIISAFNTGIKQFKMVEVPIEKIMSNIPRGVANQLFNDIEEKIKQKKINNDKSTIDIIMRSQKDFFIIEVNKKFEIKCKTIQFSHGNENILFDIYEESDGTVRLLDLLEVLLTKKDKVFVIDELDRCLHPILTYKYIELFLQVAKKRNIQLIVTTHESRLLDFGLLRRDEIWFVNRRESGESDIYSLEEYNTRFDQKIDKAYLDGRYGGIPIFTTLFPINE